MFILFKINFFYLYWSVSFVLLLFIYVLFLWKPWEKKKKLGDKNNKDSIYNRKIDFGDDDDDKTWLQWIKRNAIYILGGAVLTLASLIVLFFFIDEMDFFNNPSDAYALYKKEFSTRSVLACQKIYTLVEADIQNNIELPRRVNSAWELVRSETSALDLASEMDEIGVRRAWRIVGNTDFKAALACLEEYYESRQLHVPEPLVVWRE